MIRFNKYIFTCILHFLCVLTLLNALSFVIPSFVYSYVKNFVYFIVCLTISYYTFGLTKRKFLNDRINPEGKAVLITGCDSGFGHGLAIRLDTLGFNVYASCLYSAGPGAQELRQKCSDRLEVIQMNVTSDESVNEAFEFVRNSLRNIEFWAIVNNAGIQKGFTFDFAKIQDFRDTMEVNTYGMLRVTKTFLPLIKKFKGRIINLTSMNGRIPSYHNSMYCTSKFAATGFSDCLHLEMKEWDIPVIQVQPEFFRTPMTDYNFVSEQMKIENESVSAELREEYGDEYFEKLRTASVRFLKHACSNKTICVVDDLEAAVCLKQPDIVYYSCHSYLSTLLYRGAELQPFVLREQWFRLVCSFFSFPKPLKAKKR